MLQRVVNFRSHSSQSHLFAPLRPSPLFPSPPLSPFFLAPYSHTYTTATLQPFCNQFVTHSFPCDGGCTPLSPSRLALPPLAAQKPQFPVVDPLWIQALTKCSSRNPFPLLTIHFHGGGVPPTSATFRRWTFKRSNVPKSHCRGRSLVPQSAKAPDFFTVRGNISASSGV